MDRTPPPLPLAAARALTPPAGSRAAEVLRDGDLWIRFAARPTSGPQAPHDRDEFYIVASGTARYRWDGGETDVGPGDMMFAAAQTGHGYDRFSDDFSVWIVFYGPPRQRIEANELGQPVGIPVPGWTTRPLPPRTAMAGRFSRVEPLDPERHARDLYTLNSEDRDGRMWTYLPWGPCAGFDDYLAALSAFLRREGFVTYAVVAADSGRAAGVASYLNINAAAGSIEVGGITYSPALQRTPAGTEAMFLMMRRVFDDLGYRRYEWKCNALNAASRAAAQRYGFRYEGLFRQADVVKGRNRDTAWFAITDGEWPAIKAAFERWLDPANFDAEGRQRVALSALTGAR